MDSSQGTNPEEHQVFTQLYKEYFKSIRNFIYFRSGNMDLAEDMAQEAFVILWEKRSTMDIARVKNYLYTIVTNLFRNDLKHQKVVLKFQEQPMQTVTQESPQNVLEEHEFGKLLERVLGDMPQINREVFLMNRLEDLTYYEIAERLGLSVKAVEKRMSKALRMLRKLYPRI